ncbi:hypothetical protein APHAL10511_004411 [Amanita phalloides]|nr:hypothetical protein APHAL10511_004411 [Amanita phalloides]
MNNPSPDPEAGQATQRQQRPRSSFSPLLFLCLMLFLLTSHNSEEFLARHHYQDALQILSYQFSNYTAWLNGTSTNFTVPDRKPIIDSLLETFHIQGKELDPARESYFPNITGFIHGNLRFRNISLPALATPGNVPATSLLETYMADFNATEMEGRLGRWNWTSSDKVAFSVREKPATTIRQSVTPSADMALIHGRIELTDNGEDLRFEFEGIHLVSEGSIFGFAAPSGQQIDIRLLPAIVPTVLKNQTALAIEPELMARIQKLEKLMNAGVVDSDSSSADDAPKTACRFALYAQIKPVPVPSILMQELEEEIKRPTGRATVGVPRLLIDGMLISKECGILYEIHNTEGLRSQYFFRKVTTYAGLAALAYLVMLILFNRQAKRSRTPSGISRVSRWTFLTQATIDSVAFAGHITFAILAEGRPSLSLTAPAFLACMLFVHEAQFSVLIYQIQLPESAPPPLSPASPRNEASSEQVANADGEPAPVPNVHPPVADQPLPTPVTQTTTTNTSRSFLSFLVHHIRTDPQARLWLMLFIFLTLIVRVILSPLLSIVSVVIAYSSIWLPQVVRSARRGRTSGLASEYVIGTTACRLFFLLYFLSCPQNVLEIVPRRWTSLLVLFAFLQAMVVVLQEWLGASFFLPRHYTASQGYDYHPPVPLPDSESPDQSMGDCAICMDAIIIESQMSSRHSHSVDEKGARGCSTPGSSTAKRKGTAGQASAGTLFSAMQRGMGSVSSRKVYSLAPCHHLFHTECLERWLAIKNICPQCRRPLPPM